MKKVLKIGCLSALGLFVFLIILAILLPDPPETEVEPIEQERAVAPPVQVDQPIKTAFERLYEKAVHRVHVTQLVKDYEDNEFAADEKYKGQIILVRGNITHFADTLGTASIQLETGEILMSLTCNMHPSEKPKLAKLRKGDDVLVFGTLDGLSAGMFLTMKDCLVIPTPVE